MQTPFESIRDHLARVPPRRVVAPDAWEAAVALVLVPVEEDDHDLLLIKRAVRSGDPWSGQMALPGGRREDRDSNLLATARRETLEETGIDLPAEALLGELDDLYPNIKMLPSVVVRPFVFGLPQRPAVIPSSEVAVHVWASIGALRASQGHTDVEVRGLRRRVEAFILGEHVVWGMTHRILAPFTDLIG